LTSTVVGHGYLSTLVVTSEPKLYGYGFNDKNQLGFSATGNAFNLNSFIIYPQQVPTTGIQGTIVEISIGAHHSLIRTCKNLNFFNQ
jgi:alpha-tubulin suppressor-like RCC1 family protein